MVRAAILTLHQNPSVLVTPKPDADLPAAPNVSEEELSAVLRKVDLWSAPGANGKTERHLQGLSHSKASVTAGVHATCELSCIINRFAADNMRDSLIPLLSVARDVPCRKDNGSIRPIAVASISSRLVSKVLLKHTIESARPYLEPE